jgi:hypothetical protein
MVTVHVDEVKPYVLDFLIARLKGLEPVAIDICKPSNPLVWVAKTEAESGEVENWNMVPRSYTTSKYWAMALMDSEGISLRPVRKQGHPPYRKWVAVYEHSKTGGVPRWGKADTPELAVCKAFVAENMGWQFDVPEDLLNMEAGRQFPKRTLNRTEL